MNWLKKGKLGNLALHIERVGSKLLGAARVYVGEQRADMNYNS